MATSTASIEKVVRKVLDQELVERNEATLDAIERLSRVLTDEVIPRLPDDADDEATDDVADEPSSGNGRPQAMRAGYPKPGTDDPADDLDIPDDEDEPPADTAVPAAVADAFEVLYASLGAEQARALEELFAAIAEEPAGEAEPPEAPPAEERPRHRPARAKARFAS